MPLNTTTMKAERQQKEATSRVIQPSKGGGGHIVDNRPQLIDQAKAIRAIQSVSYDHPDGGVVQYASAFSRYVVEKLFLEAGLKLMMVGKEPLDILFGAKAYLTSVISRNDDWSEAFQAFRFVYSSLLKIAPRYIFVAETFKVALLESLKRTEESHAFPQKVIRSLALEIHNATLPYARRIEALRRECVGMDLESEDKEEDEPKPKLEPEYKPHMSPRTRKLDALSEGESENEDPTIVFRSLRPEEDPFSSGIKPPEGHDPEITASKHIVAGTGSKVKSSWVSTSRSIKVAAAWSSESTHRMARIKLPRDLAPPRMYDLTNPDHAQQIFPTGKGSSLNTAKASQEVIIKDGLDESHILALYETTVITVKEYNELKKRLGDGEEIFIHKKKVYSVVRTRTTASSSPKPRLILELKGPSE